jgi:hypothetical protein
MCLWEMVTALVRKSLVGSLETINTTPTGAAFLKPQEPPYTPCAPWLLFFRSNPSTTSTQSPIRLLAAARYMRCNYGSISTSLLSSV